MLTGFSPEVIEQLGYYVYRLIYPRNGQTFYVGKGTGNRVFQHVKGAVEYYKDGVEISDEDPNKLRIIKEIINEGLDVIHVIQRWGLTDRESRIVESALIDAFQGLSNIQRGYDADHGVTNAESLEKRLSTHAYDEPTDFKYIIIKVRDWRLEELVEKYPETYRYEATRFAWRIKPRSTKEYPYVFSVTNGIVKGVYKVKNWFFVEDRSGRIAFNGDVAEKSVWERFVDKRIPDYYVKKGMASPVLFSKNK